jgi:hypothetical protein
MVEVRNAWEIFSQKWTSVSESCPKMANLSRIFPFREENLAVAQHPNLSSLPEIEASISIIKFWYDCFKLICFFKFGPPGPEAAFYFHSL